MWISGPPSGVGAALAGFSVSGLLGKNLSESERGELQEQVAQFARTTPFKQCLQRPPKDPPLAPAIQPFTAMALASL